MPMWASDYGGKGQVWGKVIGTNTSVLFLSFCVGRRRGGKGPSCYQTTPGPGGGDGHLMVRSVGKSVSRVLLDQF